MNMETLTELCIETTKFLLPVLGVNEITILLLIGIKYVTLISNVL